MYDEIWDYLGDKRLSDTDVNLYEDETGQVYVAIHGADTALRVDFETATVVQIDQSEIDRWSWSQLSELTLTQQRVD